jgi:hypothetical protein
MSLQRDLGGPSSPHPQQNSRVPTRRREDLIHPASMPVVVLTSHDISELRNSSYAGPAIETVNSRQKDGSYTRRRGLVARMVCTIGDIQDPGSAIASYDHYYPMAAVLKYHPKGAEIAKALCDYHANNLYRENAPSGSSSSPYPNDRRKRPADASMRKPSQTLCGHNLIT